MTDWVLVNASTKPTASGGPLTAKALAAIAWAVQKQVSEDFAPTCGIGPCTVRVAGGPTDIKRGEKPFAFVDALPNGSNALAADAYCAVPTCVDLFGPSGVSIDVSQEVLQDLGNPDCNAWVNDGRGWQHSWERCNAVETQSYAKKHPSGQLVYVSNFLLTSWVDPSSRGPFTYMATKGIKGFIEPPGPFRTAAGGGGGNFQLVLRNPPKGALPKPIESAMEAIQGFPSKRNAALHSASRASRIIRAHNLATQSSK